MVDVEQCQVVCKPCFAASVGTDRQKVAVELQTGMAPLYTLITSQSVVAKKNIKSDGALRRQGFRFEAHFLHSLSWGETLQRA